MAFDWDEANVTHLKRHRVTAADFEQVFQNDPLDLDYQNASDEERYRSLGLTDGGRALIVVWTVRHGRIRAITAHTAPKFYKRLFGGECDLAMAKRRIPKFRNEAEEATWWEKNREELDKDFLAAAREGRLGRLTKEKLQERLAKSSRAVTIRLAEEDLSLARKQAAEKGLPYQTYIKSLLHEALRKAG